MFSPRKNRFSVQNYWDISWGSFYLSAKIRIKWRVFDYYTTSLYKKMQQLAPKHHFSWVTFSCSPQKDEDSTTRAINICFKKHKNSSTLFLKNTFRALFAPQIATILATSNRFSSRARHAHASTQWFCIFCCHICHSPDSILKDTCYKNHQPVTKRPWNKGKTIFSIYCHPEKEIGFETWFC